MKGRRSRTAIRAGAPRRGAARFGDRLALRPHPAFARAGRRGHRPRPLRDRRAQERARAAGRARIGRSSSCANPARWPPSSRAGRSRTPRSPTPPAPPRRALHSRVRKRPRAPNPDGIPQTLRLRRAAAALPARRRHHALGHLPRHGPGGAAGTVPGADSPLRQPARARARQRLRRALARDAESFAALSSLLWPLLGGSFQRALWRPRCWAWVSTMEPIRPRCTAPPSEPCPPGGARPPRRWACRG